MEKENWQQVYNELQEILNEFKELYPYVINNKFSSKKASSIGNEKFYKLMNRGKSIIINNAEVQNLFLENVEPEIAYYKMSSLDEDLEFSSCIEDILNKINKR